MNRFAFLPASLSSAVCAPLCSAIIIGLAVGPAETASLGTMLI